MVEVAFVVEFADGEGDDEEEEDLEGADPADLGRGAIGEGYALGK